MKLAIMQPYFFPYIGYFQLIKAVDQFIVYDNIKYTKKGWINRNRILRLGKDEIFSLPLKNDSDFKNICDREISGNFKPGKLLSQFADAYRHASYFAQTMPLIEDVVRHKDVNLFRFLNYSITRTCAHLGIDTPITVSSNVDIDHGLRSEAKVLALCQAMAASVYINAIGGLELYKQSAFQAQGIALKFIRCKAIAYPQFGNAFVPSLSIIDVMMFNPISAINEFLVSGYELVQPLPG